MTIAAGFHFDLGILLCADTQYTGNAKSNQTKITKIRHHAATLVTVLAGRQMYAARGLELIRRGVTSLPENQLSRGKLQDIIEQSLRELFDKHIYTHPDWGKENAPDFSFVIGLYSPIDGHCLLATEETICAELPDRVCLGSGSYLGDYLSRMYRGKDCTLDDMVSLAIYILQQTKSYDSYCGGSSEFITLWDDGDTSQVNQYDVSIGESYSELFTKCVSNIFYAAADLNRSVDDLRDKLYAEVEPLVANQKIRKTEKTRYDELTKGLYERVRKILGEKQ